MRERNSSRKKEVFSKALRAGKRTYFFDVKETRAGDHYLTITESKKKLNEDGSFDYEKHKIFLYKEDFSAFQEFLNEMSAFILGGKEGEMDTEDHQSERKEKKENE